MQVLFFYNSIHWIFIFAHSCLLFALRVQVVPTIFFMPKSHLMLGRLLGLFAILRFHSIIVVDYPLFVLLANCPAIATSVMSSCELDLLLVFFAYLFISLPIFSHYSSYTAFHGSLCDLKCCC